MTNQKIYASQIGHITQAIKQANFSKEEIKNCIENFKESRSMLEFRKKQNLSFRKFRRILIELLGVKENAL